MGLCRLFFIALCIHWATAATVRKPPAFATPIYSDSYLPASMQVIFNIVEQLKRIEAEEGEQNLISNSATSPHPPGQKQPLPTTPSTIGTSDENQTVTVSDEEKYYIPPERYQEEALIIAKPENKDYEKIAEGQITPEVNHEESEVVYGVPESNYELPEPNHEIPEEDADNIGENDHKVDKPEEGTSSSCNEFKTSSEPVPSDSTTSIAVDSVVKEIYSIIKTSSLDVKNASSSSNEDKNIAEKSSSDDCMEGKNSPEYMPEEKLEENKERTDELKDDKRFTLLGERIDQVPRPSLVAFLRASNATSSPSLSLLGELYDALSKDARRQGFSKFSGYSEKVLKFLEESAGGGAGVQLKELLEKAVENKELTRYDAMEKTKESINSLKDAGSRLSTDLRRLIPLRFVA